MDLDRGEIDFLLDGSIFFAKHASRLGNFQLLPYASELILAGWGVKKEDEALARLIRSGTLLQVVEDA